MIAGHPLDEVFLAVLDAMLQDENVDAVMVLFPAFLVRGNEARFLDVMGRSRGKPVVAWPDNTIGPLGKPITALEKAGVGFFPTVDRAARVLSCLHQRWQYLTSVGAKTQLP